MAVRPWRGEGRLQYLGGGGGGGGGGVKLAMGQFEHLGSWAVWGGGGGGGGGASPAPPP